MTLREDVMVTFDIPTNTSGFFQPFWDIIERIAPVYEQRVKQVLTTYAQNTHRYTSHSGRLREHTKATGSFAEEIILTVDPSVDYAKYVVFDPYNDNFIKGAMVANEETVREIVMEMYNEAITEWNRQ